AQRIRHSSGSSISELPVPSPMPGSSRRRRASVSHVKLEIRALKSRLEGQAQPDPWAESASLLDRAVLESLPCAVCLEAYIATILVWRERGITNPPGRDPTSLGTLWAWSGGSHTACRSHCLLS